MRVAGVDTRREDAPPSMAEMHPPEALDRLLPGADLVIMTAPHTPHTEGMMDAARFALIKPSGSLPRQRRARHDREARRPEPAATGEPASIRSGRG